MAAQTIIISGASRGLGAATARISAKLGATVVLNARSAVPLQKVAQEIRAVGGKALAVPGDISLEEECRNLIETAVAQTGSIDALINNASTLDPLTSMATADPQELQHNLAVNLLGPMLLTQAAMPYLRQAQGRVINVSSGAAVNNIAGWGAYSISKAALNHFTRQLAEEEEQITAVSFRPGIIDTDMQAQIRREGQEDMSAERYAYFQHLHLSHQLLPPDLPGKALAILALYAPPQWSGEFLRWNADKVQQLIKTVNHQR
jgi:NAD(P)-dependent dehydrogenase (short-subunit alcohol dehydrogenase family)